LPKQERLTPVEAESLLVKNGFVLLRIKGSHRIYGKEHRRITIPFHKGKILHPKIIKQVFKMIS